MLENALDAYLAHLLNEREFDAPFLALLPAMGFFDVHYTHGSAEFGKDFIAKKRQGRTIVQYSFQSKRDVLQAGWREIQNQLVEAVLTPLSHPHFDPRKPHQPVLVVTGRFSGNAAIGATNLNATLTGLKARPLQVWDRPQLISLLASYNLAGVHRATAENFQAHGRFYSLYGDAMEGQLTPREVERYSRHWLVIPDTPPNAGDGAENGNGTEHDPFDTNQPHTNQSNTIQATTIQAATRASETSHRLLLAALESAMLAARCRAVDAYYEALHCHLAAWRAVLHAWHCARESHHDLLVQQCRALHERIQATVREAAREYAEWVERLWRKADCNLACCIGGIPGMATALVMAAPLQCARFVETQGLRFQLAASREERDGIVAVLKEFVEREPNCAYPISERYAVSMVWPLLALGQSGHGALARHWLQRVLVWLCDRHELGAGLARLEASVGEEIDTLLGSSFDFISIEHFKHSLLATALADLTVWLGEENLYSDLLNDLQAVGIIPHFFQICDSEGAFRFEASDIRLHPRVTYLENFSPFREHGFASHISREPAQLGLSGEIGLDALAAVSMLLRDRYFPRQWPLPTLC